MNKVEELVNYLNMAYGLEAQWPETFEVSPELYGRVCDALLKYLIEKNVYTLVVGKGYRVELAVGRKGGVMFKNVELLIKKEVAT